MDGYAVKAGELGKLIGDLGTAAGRMADANRKLGGGGAFGSLGTAELGKAGVEFEEAWGYGIGRLGDAASDITERLKQAKGKYEQIEAEFGEGLSKFGSAVLTGGVPGVDEQASGTDPGGGIAGGFPGIEERASGPDRGAGLGDPGGGMVGGGATGGIADLLNGLDR